MVIRSKFKQAKPIISLNRCKVFFKHDILFNNAIMSTFLRVLPQPMPMLEILVNKNRLYILVYGP